MAKDRRKQSLGSRRRATPKTRCSGIGSLGMALSPRAERGRIRDLSQVLLEEGGDRVEGGAGRALLVVDVDDLDVAARLAVVRDEPLGLVAGEVGIVIMVVVHDVGAA